MICTQYYDVKFCSLPGNTKKATFSQTGRHNNASGVLLLFGFFCLFFWGLFVCFVFKLALPLEQAVFSFSTWLFRATNRNQKLPRALRSTPDGIHFITSLSKVQRMPWIWAIKKKIYIYTHTWKEVKSGRKIAAVSTTYYFLCHRHELSCNSVFVVTKQPTNKLSSAETG